MKKKGFTLLETLVVVAIFAVLGALTVPYSARSYRHYIMTVETKNIISIMRRAQNMAMANTYQSTFGIKFNATSYVLFRGASYAARNSAYDETYQIANAITVTGPSEIVFQQFSGKPATNTTITVASSEKSQTITLGKEGIINW